MSRNIVTVKHPDGSGTTTYRYVAAGGFFRPGVIVITAHTLGSNAPVVLTQASGAPMAPSLTGAPAQIGEAAILARGLRERNSHDSVRVVNVPGSEPPPLPEPPPVNRPPWGEGHGHGPRGH